MKMRKQNARLNRLLIIVLLAITASIVMPQLNPSMQADAATSTEFVNDARWKNGRAWGGGQKPLLSNYSSSGCVAYAADFAKFCYGKDSPWSGTRFGNPSEIRNGDIIQVSGHTFVVISRNGNALYTAEGNFSGKVRVATDVYTIKNNVINDKFNGNLTMVNGYHFTADPGSGNQKPIAALDTITSGLGTITVSGWAYDPDEKGKSIEVQAYIGGNYNTPGVEILKFKADQPSDGLNSAYGLTGKHRFSITLKTSKTGTQTVNMWAIDTKGSNNTNFATSTINIKPNQKPVAALDTITGGEGCITVSGWAYDPDEKGKSIEVQAYIGGNYNTPGVEIHKFKADQPSDGLNSAYGLTGKHRFSVTLNTQKTGAQTVNMWAIDAIGRNNTNFKTTSVTIKVKPVDTAKPEIKNVKVVKQTKDTVIIEADITDNVKVANVSNSVRSAYGKYSENGIQLDITDSFKQELVSGNTYRFTLKKKPVTEKNLLYIIASDAARNESYAKVPFNTTAHGYLNMRVGQTVDTSSIWSYTNVTTEWSDYSDYGTVIKYQNNAITALKAGKATIAYWNKSTGESVAMEVVVSNTAANEPIVAPKGKIVIRNTIANSAKRTNDVIWDKSKVVGATNYEINWKARGAKKSVSRILRDTVKGTTSGLTIGGLYEIKVRPVLIKGAKRANGAWSPTVYRYFHTTQKIRLKSSKRGNFVMSWAKNSKATGYQVMFTTNKNGAGAAKNINTLGVNATSFTKTGLRSGTTYYVQVRELRKVGNTTYVGNISCPVAVKIK